MIISVFNLSANVQDQEILDTIDAVNAQILHHFAPRWSLSAQLQPVASGGQVPSPGQLSTAAIYICDTPQGLQPGFHRANTSSTPYGYVFTELAIGLGIAWSVTFSHEVLELLVDPQLNSLMAGPAPGNPAQTVKYLKEVCDPVQLNTYQINNIDVSNFVTPSYFSAGPPAAQTDYLGTGIAPFGVNPGGYVEYEDPKSGGLKPWADAAGMRIFRQKEKYLGRMRRVRRHAIAKPVARRKR